MNLEQRLTVAKLQAQGFALSDKGGDVVMVRGNDHRIVWHDGSQHRAKGAKR